MSYAKTAHIKPYGITAQWSEGRGALREFMSPFVQARYAAHVVGLGAVLADAKPKASLAVRTALGDFVGDFNLFMMPGTISVDDHPEDYMANPVVLQNVRDTLNGVRTPALASEADDFRTVYTANSAQQLNFARSMVGYCAVNDMDRPEQYAQKIRNTLGMAEHFMQAFPQLVSAPEFKGTSYEPSLELLLSLERYDYSFDGGHYNDVQSS